MEEQEDDVGAFPSSGAEPGSHELAARLKAAVREAGGNNLVAQRAGVPLSTLNSYLRGVEMKVGGLLKLAAATGVRLEWLATGQGPMRPGEGLMQVGGGLGESAATPGLSEAPREEQRGIGLAWQANRDRLGAAYEKAMNSLVAPPGQRVDPKILMGLTLLLYDDMTEEAERLKRREPPR